MADIEIKGERFEVTDEEKAEYDRLVAQGVHPEIALAIATGDEDLVEA